MRRILLTLAICAILVTPVLAKDPTNTVYIANFSEDNVPTGAAGTKTAIAINADVARVVKIYGGLKQGETSTSWDLKLFSDNVAGTEQEDTLYSVDNITAGFINDDTPFFITSTGSTEKTIYFQITNDGNASDFDLWLLYEPYWKKP